MHEVFTVRGDLRELYCAATRAGEQLHAAMLRYCRAQTAPEMPEKMRDCLEDYIAHGQQYRTTLEMLLAVLATSPLKGAQDEAERVEGVLWRHDEQLRRLYARLMAGRPEGSRQFQL